MSLVSQDLPSDPDALRALVAALQTQLAEKDLAIAARDAEIHAKTLHIEKLKAQLAVLRRARGPLAPSPGTPRLTSRWASPSSRSGSTARAGRSTAGCRSCAGVTR